MNYKVFAIYDSKSKAFSQPFYAINEEVAIRNFASAIADPKTELNKHPEDFSLHLLGTFDDGLGIFDSEGPQVNLGLAANFKEQI